MLFIAILLLTVFAIAGSAAFFSVYGLAAIFSGAFIPVVIMAGSLEIGKLVAASFLYRYWQVLSYLMRTYLFGAIFILMFITSIGIFGFLSAAYQEDVLPLDDMNAQISVLEDRKLEITGLKQELTEERAELDLQVAQIPETHSTNRRRMRESQQADRDRIRSEIQRLTAAFQATTEEQGNLRRTIIQQEVHTGPIIFIAQALGRDIDDAVKWMIILIIFAFDPLAVVLTVGANIAIVKRKELTGETIEVWGVDLGEAQHIDEKIPQAIPAEHAPVEIDYDEIAKRISVPEAPEIDYDEIAKRIEVQEQVVDIDIDELAEKVAARVPDREHLIERETIREVPKAAKRQTRDVTVPGRTKED